MENFFDILFGFGKEYAAGGPTGYPKKTWIVNINDPAGEAGHFKLRKEEIELGPKSDEFDVKQAIIRKQHGSSGSFLGNGTVLSIVEKK